MVGNLLVAELRCGLLDDRDDVRLTLPLLELDPLRDAVRPDFHHATPFFVRQDKGTGAGRKGRLIDLEYRDGIEKAATGADRWRARRTRERSKALRLTV